VEGRSGTGRVARPDKGTLSWSAEGATVCVDAVVSRVIGKFK